MEWHPPVVSLVDACLSSWRQVPDLLCVCCARAPPPVRPADAAAICADSSTSWAGVRTDRAASADG
eukprot:2156322-Rhodomonas_salina.1